MVNKCCILLIFDRYVQLVIYMQCDRHICSGHIPVICNVCIPVLLVTLLIVLFYVRYIYWHNSLLSMHEVIGIFMTFGGISFAGIYKVVEW